MQVIDRIEGARGRVRGRWYEMRSRDLGRRTEALKSEVKELRAELERERDERRDLMSALRARQGRPSPLRRGARLFRIIAVAGGAYVLGTRAGHERYEQIRERAKHLGERVRSGAETSHTPNGAYAPIA